MTHSTQEIAEVQLWGRSGGPFAQNSFDLFFGWRPLCGSVPHGTSSPGNYANPQSPFTRDSHERPQVARTATSARVADKPLFYFALTAGKGSARHRQIVIKSSADR